MQLDTRVINDLRLTTLPTQLVDEVAAFSKYHFSGTWRLAGLRLGWVGAKDPSSRRDRPAAAVPGGPKSGV